MNLYFELDQLGRLYILNLYNIETENFQPKENPLAHKRVIDFLQSDLTELSFRTSFIV